MLGGTFDPVHAGHVAVARQARHLLGLDRVLLVPSSRPPHREPPVAGAEDRLAMTRLAVAGEAGLEADDVEVRRGGTSYTVDTLRELRRRHPGGELVLLVGEDAALDLATWREGAAIAGLASLVVFNRSRSSTPPDDEAHPAGPHDPSAAATRLTVESPDISATAVRAALARHEDLAEMLPPSVLEYIRERGLYSPPPGSAGEGAVIIPPQ